MTAECGKLRADGTFLKSLVMADLGLPLTHLIEKEERNRGLRKV